MDELSIEARSSLTLPDNNTIPRIPLSFEVTEEVVKAGLKAFFETQDPLFLFIHRGAFISDYYDNAHSGKYWSYPLLYAICALGIKTLSDISLRSKSDVLRNCAESMIMSQEIGRPKITVAQALLCLAYYELGSGNNSKGWLLAGMSSKLHGEMFGVCF